MQSTMMWINLKKYRFEDSSVRDKELSLPTRRPSGECHGTEICKNL